MQTPRQLLATHHGADLAEHSTCVQHTAQHRFKSAALLEYSLIVVIVGSAAVTFLSGLSYFVIEFANAVTNALQIIPS